MALRKASCSPGVSLSQDPGQRFGGAIEPVADQGRLAGDDLDDRAPPVGRVRAPLDQACAVKVGEYATDRGKGQVQPGGQFPDGERAGARICSSAATCRGLRGEGTGAGAARSCQRRIPLVTRGNSCIRRRHNAECSELPA